MIRSVYSCSIRLREPSATRAGAYDVSGYLIGQGWSAHAEVLGPALRPQVRQHDDPQPELMTRAFHEAHRVANATLPSGPSMGSLGSTGHRLITVSYYPNGREWFAGPGISVTFAPLPGVEGHPFSIEQTRAHGTTMDVLIDMTRTHKPARKHASCAGLTDAERALLEGGSCTLTPSRRPGPKATAVAADPRLVALLETPACSGPSTLSQVLTALPQLESLMVRIVDRLEHA